MPRSCQSHPALCRLSSDPGKLSEAACAIPAVVSSSVWPWRLNEIKKPETGGVDDRSRRYTMSWQEDVQMFAS
eukprot:12900259-Prorocentrum_lima.AAC.1